MPLNPLTGQVDYGGASYDPQNMNAGMAMRAQAKADVDVPFIFDMAESLPGVTTMALFNARRYANTLEKGGRFDVGKGVTGRKLTRAKKFGAMVGNSNAPVTASQFPGAKGILSFYGRNKAAKGRVPMLRASRANNITANPRAIGRFTSLNSLAGASSKAYTPFQGIPAAINALMKSSRVSTRLGMAGFDPKTQNAYSGGVLGRITSLNRLNTLENIIAKGPGNNRFSLAKYNRASATRMNMVSNIARVGNVANPATSVYANTQATRLQAQFARSATARAHRALPPMLARSASAAARGVSAAGSATTTALNAAAATRRAALFAAPMKFLAEEMTTGKLSNKITAGYLGMMNVTDMTKGQSALFNRVVARAGATADDALGRQAVARMKTNLSVGGKYSGGVIKQARGGAEMLKVAGQYAKSGGSRIAAAKFAGMGAARIGGAALGPLNVLATGQLMYDLAKGAGKIAVKGMNFGKDAIKSMQGTIGKPMFGSGFKDNEIAATSRSRGVMAIQNSRLNARSLLGSEASMLSAHFG